MGMSVLWTGKMDFEATSVEIESNGPMVLRGRECRRTDWHVIDSVLLYCPAGAVARQLYFVSCLVANRAAHIMQ